MVRYSVTKISNPVPGYVLITVNLKTSNRFVPAMFVALVPPQETRTPPDPNRALGA